MKRLGLAIGLTLLASSASADNRIRRLLLTTSVTGNVIERMSYELRERVRASHGYRLVESRQDADYILVLNGFDTKIPWLAVYSVTLLAPESPRSPLDYHLADYVATCPSSEVATCATSAIAFADETLESMTRAANAPAPVAPRPQ